MPKRCIIFYTVKPLQVFRLRRAQESVLRHFNHNGNNPLNTCVAGPVRTTSVNGPLPLKSTVNIPPCAYSLTGEAGTQPWATATIAAAVAPVPQANVSFSTPRSYVRMESSPSHA